MLISLLVIVIFIAGCFTETPAPKTDKTTIKVTPTQEEAAQSQETDQSANVVQDIDEYDAVEDTSDVDDLTSGFEGL